MKFNKNIRITAVLLSLSAQYLLCSTPARSRPAKSVKLKSPVYDVQARQSYEVIAPETLIVKHQKAKIAEQPSWIQSNFAEQITPTTTPRYLKTSSVARTTTKPLNMYDMDNATFFAVDTPEKVTPAALLQSVLHKHTLANGKFDTKAAFKTLNDLENNHSQEYQDLQSETSMHKDPAKKLIRDSKILLIRAHPEVVPGLGAKLSYMPERFISYFQEALPSFTTTAGKQRFTQSVMMEILKNINKANKSRDFLDKREANLALSNKNYEGISDVHQKSFIKKEYQDKNNQETLNNLLIDYADQLDVNTTQAQFVRWWQNVTIELALLAPRLTGTALGVATGAAIGGVTGLTTGAVMGGAIGLAASTNNKGQATTGILIAVPTGAGIGAGAGTALGTGVGAISGGVSGYRAGESAARYVGNKISDATSYAYNKATGKKPANFFDRPYSDTIYMEPGNENYTI